MRFNRKHFFFFAVVFAVRLEATCLEEGGAALENLRQGFFQLMVRHRPPTKVITFVADDSSRQVVKTLLGDLHVSVAVFDEGQPEIYRSFAYDAVVFVLRNLSRIEQSLPSSRPFWNADTKFIVVATGPVLPATAQNMFRMFWRRRIVKAVLLLTNKDLLEGHGFAPYSKNKCGDPEATLVLTKEPDKPAWIHPELHQEITDLRGCQLNVTYRESAPFVIIEENQPVRREHLKGIEGL